MNETLNLPAAPWWRHRWPWLLMLGPALVAVAGSYTGYLAYSRQDALVVGDYYKQGKAINQDLRRDRAATALGLNMALRYDPAGGQLAGRVVGAGMTAPAGTLQLHLAHATQPEKDVRLLLKPDHDGYFSVSLPLLERSRWTVLLEDDQRAWRLEGHWEYPLQRELAVQADAR
ncbi:MAG: FixH family protein [Sphingomonadaceae bacterium]